MFDLNWSLMNQTELIAKPICKYKLIFKDMKTTALLVSFSLVCLCLFATKVDAANTGTVNATVTAQNVSVTVADGAIAYGILAVSTSKSTISTDLNDLQTATNSGNVPEDFNIKGSNSAAWTLAATPGVEQYSHKFCTASCTTPPTNYTALTTSYQTLGLNIATAGTKTFDLQLSTPTSTAVFTAQNVDITIQAVAH